MTYSKNFEDIREICEKLAELEPGELLRVGPLGNVTYIRWKIYSWLHETGLKKVFIVRTKRDTLEIERRETEFRIEKVRIGELSKRLESFLEKALLKEKKGGGREYIKSLYDSGEISLAELADLLEKFLEVER